jgi:hypothetical protein
MTSDRLKNIPGLFIDRVGAAPGQIRTSYAWTPDLWLPTTVLERFGPQAVGMTPKASIRRVSAAGLKVCRLTHASISIAASTR